MTASEFEHLAFPYLRGTCSASQQAEMEDFLEANPQKRAELEELRRLWGRLGELPVPQPGPGMDARFREMLLDRAMETALSGRDIRKGSPWRGRTAIPNWLLAGCLLLGGFLMGRYLFQPSLPVSGSSTVIQSEFEPDQKTILTLLGEPVASERLKAINRVADMNQADEQVIRALLQTLITDTNVNVRLAAIEALRNYIEIPLVREGLIGAIRHQDSPLVQLSLAELMVAIQEARSVESIRTIIEQEQTDSVVKKALQESIRQII